MKLEIGEKLEIEVNTWITSPFGDRGEKSVFSFDYDDVVSALKILRKVKEKEGKDEEEGKDDDSSCRRTLTSESILARQLPKLIKIFDSDRSREDKLLGANKLLRRLKDCSKENASKSLINSLKTLVKLNESEDIFNKNEINLITSFL